MLSLDKKWIVGLGLFTAGGLYYIHSIYIQMNELKASLSEANYQKEIIKLQALLNADKEQKDYLQRELDKCQNYQNKKVALPPLKLPPL